MVVFEKEIPVDAYLFIDIDGKIFRYHFKRRTTLIGRDSSNDVIINHSNLLEHHATITFSRGMFLLTPIEHGLVKLNGERVEDTTPVNSCDSVTIGGFDCQFAIDNGVSDTALLMICRREKGDFWIVSRQTMLFVGKEKGDIVIPDDSLVKSPFLLENFGENCQFISTVKGGGEITLNNRLVSGRLRLVNGDHVALASIKIKFHFMKSAFMDDPDESLTPEGLKRFRIEYQRDFLREVIPHSKPAKVEQPLETEEKKEERVESASKKRDRRVIEEAPVPLYGEEFEDLKPVKSRQEIDFKKGGHTMIISTEEVEEALKKDK